MAEWVEISKNAMYKAYTKTISLNYDRLEVCGVFVSLETLSVSLETIPILNVVYTPEMTNPAHFALNFNEV